jgi:hypothetical protein
MKKVILILIFSVLFISCDKEDPIKEKTILEVKSKIKNPDSFEYVNYEIFKKVNFKEAKIGLPIILELIKYSSGVDKKNYQKQVDFINNNKDETQIAYYDIYLTAKGTNSFGAIIQSKYYLRVLNNDNFDVVIIKEK